MTIELCRQVYQMHNFRQSIDPWSQHLSPVSVVLGCVRYLQIYSLNSFFFSLTITVEVCF